MIVQTSKQDMLPSIFLSYFDPAFEAKLSKEGSMLYSLVPVWPKYFRKAIGGVIEVDRISIDDCDSEE